MDGLYWCLIRLRLRELERGLASLFFLCYNVCDFITTTIMPSFYELGKGGGQFSPEAINRRRKEELGEPVTPDTKKDLVEALVDIAVKKGETVSRAQIDRWNKMTMPNLQKLTTPDKEAKVEPEVVAKADTKPQLK